MLLVRHAMPVATADLPPDRWVLSDDGCRAAEQLRGRLPTDAAVVSSPETKAVSTLALALDVPSAAIRTDQRLAEVNRPGEPFDDDAAERRGCWVEGRPDVRHTGWETPAAAAARFSAALAELNAERVVVGAHGMIATAWLISIGHLRPGAVAGGFWRTLGFPAVVEVSLDRIDPIR